MLQILTLVGSIGLFLYGMKIMSEALQKIAGSRMRKALRTMSNSPLEQVGVGMMATSIIQSSSATTVMVVSFVNANLITLIQSLGMIMGANIGTTTTAWIIALLGFNLNLGVIAIPLIGFGFPLLLNKSSNSRAWGNNIIGFALLFVAVGFMKDSIVVLNNYTWVTDFFACINNMGFSSVLIYLGLGILLATITQSSTAAVVLTIVMCNHGMMPFELGAAMIVGENIGTTIVSNIVASRTNINARRTALFHLMFNLFGAVIVTIFIGPFTELVSDMMVSLGGCSPKKFFFCTPFALAMFHTMLNLGNTFLLIGFTRNIADILSKIIKAKKNDKYQLQYMDSGMFATGAISIVQAQQSIRKYASQTSSMFSKVSEMFKESNQERFYALFEEIERQERSTNEGEKDFNTFLANAMKGDIGNEAKEQIRRLTKLASDIEVMSDAIYSVAKIVKRRKDKGAWFTPELRTNVLLMFELIDSAIVVMNNNLKALLSNHKKFDIEEALKIEEIINQKRTELKEMPHHSDEGVEIDFLSWAIFTDIIGKSEGLADAIFRISRDVAKALDLEIQVVKSNE
ncbi:MAG: Na/Pi symporter [Rikenellaceae bacterium]